MTYSVSVDFPGLENAAFLSFSYTCSTGVSPGVLSLTVVKRSIMAVIPSDGLEPGGSTVLTVGAYGDFAIADGVNPPIVFRGVRLARVAPTDDDALITLHFLDRRISWREGAISAYFNQIEQHPEPAPQAAGEMEEGDFQPVKFVTRGGPFVRGTQRQTSEILTRLANQIGEPITPRNVDLTANPPCNWYFVPPGVALDQIATFLGGVVVYQPIANRVLVDAPTGAGTWRDDLPYMTGTAEINYPSPPATFTIVGAPINYAEYFFLEAVGYEEDGRIRSIWDLSYMPKKGWRSYAPGHSHWEDCVKGDCSGINVAYALAKQFVWRMFRPKAIAGDVPGRGVAERKKRFGPMKIKFDAKAQLFKIVNPKQFELSDRIIKTEKDVLGNLKSVDAEMYGNAYNYGWQFKFDTGKNLDKGTRLATHFTVDSAKGLITTADHLYRNVEPVKITGAWSMFDQTLNAKWVSTGVPELVGEFDLQWSDAAQAWSGLFRGAVSGAYVAATLTPANIGGGLIGWTLALAGETYTFGAISVPNTSGNQTPEGSYPFFVTAPTVGTAALNFASKSGWNVEEAELFYRCSVRIRNPDTMQFVAGTWSKTYGDPNGLPEHVVVKQELGLAYVVRRLISKRGERIDPILTNEPDMAAAANYYLDAERRKYIQKVSGTRRYTGLLAIDPDAALQSVTWSWDDLGHPYTTVSLGTEHDPYLPNALERRQNEAHLAFITRDWVNGVLGTKTGEYMNG